ncbi:hypothetical protein CR152_27780 [Massilia violaceinigra]|uniref:Uncharacterized protein n=1 Tax=Massilia violaceinigra TaxID=2045208 RepID=A0A2D2DSD7_9BURK|nr:hypothetical protein [Massilia violaceinigra]ATQ77878.1 hypothetical protein CR152_27780 [Massilia violaceinigra]
MSDINWYGEDQDSSVIFNSVNALAVYINTSGELVIRQQGANGEDDSVIALPKMFVPMLLSAITKAMAE